MPQRLERKVNDDEGKPVHVRTKMHGPSERMLEMLVTELRAAADWHSSYEHSIVIDETELSTIDQHVSVL